MATYGHQRDADLQALIDAGQRRRAAVPAAAVILIVWHATSPAVINPRREMPPRWARVVGIAIPRTTMAVFVFEIAIAAPFGDSHDRRRVTLKTAKWIIRCGSRRVRWNSAQQRKHQQRRS